MSPEKLKMLELRKIFKLRDSLSCSVQPEQPVGMLILWDCLV